MDNPKQLSSTGDISRPYDDCPNFGFQSTKEPARYGIVLYANSLGHAIDLFTYFSKCVTHLKPFDITRITEL